jgi:hypothetical protein
MRTRQGLAVTTVSCIAAATLLAGCGGGRDGGATSGSADNASSAKGAPQGALDAAGEPGSAASESGSKSSPGDKGAAARETSARVLPADRDVVYRGQITVRVKDVTAAAARAESYATAVDGVVFAEQTTIEPDRQGAASASLTLRVPPTQFRPMLDRLAGLGKALTRSQTAEDVTTQVVDLESRLSSQRRSVERIRALLDKATTIGQIVQVEGELARREADLESLEAQREKLKDVTDLATIELSLVSPGAKPPPAVKDDRGFLAGLRGGWDALVAVVAVALTAAGALLPFVITLALVGVPGWFLIRARRRSPATAPTPDAT